MADPILMRTLGRMEGKLDALHEVVEKHLKDDEKVEERVRKVERRQSWFMGGMAACGVFFAAVWKIMTG